jgi:predicted nucleic acid-binding protein
VDTAKTRTILDSNIVLDALFQEAEWHEWSLRTLAAEAEAGDLLINPVIFAEASPRFESYAAFRQSLLQLDIAFEHLPWEVAYRAGRAHAVYRKLGGLRERTLPDFFIGAHASVSGLQLITRDPVRYRSYFPNIKIIAPDTHP